MIKALKLNLVVESLFLVLSKISLVEKINNFQFGFEQYFFFFLLYLKSPLFEFFLLIQNFVITTSSESFWFIVSMGF